MPLPIRVVDVEGYRSLRRVRLPLDDLTVFVGANGVGKTNLYRALQLLQAAAAGTLSREIAAEGGMAAALWTGRRSPGKPVRIRLGVEVADGQQAYAYEVEIGLVPQVNDNGIRAVLAAGFLDEPQIKEESLSFISRGKRRRLMVRKGPSLQLADEKGRLAPHDQALLVSETALGAFDEPSVHPELHLVRQSLLACRFLHEVRVDRDAPVRRPSLAVTTPVLASDASDLAAVFATLFHIRGDMVDVDRAIEDAFPGAALIVPEPDSHCSFGLSFPEHPMRVFGAQELSDGTLRYLALVGALLSYRPAPFMALNEPETSLHPDLMEPLARLIVRAAAVGSRIWAVTHSDRLANALAEHGGVRPRRVLKVKGETTIEGLRLDGAYDEDGDEDEDD